MAKTEDIAHEIARSLGDESLVDKLASLPASELTSLLLAVHRAQHRAQKRTFASARAHHEHSEMFRGSRADARLLRVVEEAFLEAAHAFELIDLAPTVPLGLAALTGVDPNNTLAALRGAELLADPTAAMALEVASRRRRDHRVPVRLASSSRVLRMQPLPVFEGASRHFRLLALVSSVHSRDEERAALKEHVLVWLSMTEELAARGFSTSNVRLEIAHTRPSSLGADDTQWRDDYLLPSLRHRFPRVACVVDGEREQGRGYYDGWMLHVCVRDNHGEWLAFGDGGVVTWTGAMIGDARERLVTSGFGAELLVKRAAPTLTTTPPPSDALTSLRPAVVEDIGPLLQILRSPTVAARWPGYDEARVRAWVAGSAICEPFAIVRGGVVVGGMQLEEETDPEYAHASLDMFIDDDVSGQGVAAAAVLAGLALLRARGVRRFVIDPARDNIAARRVYGRCGFRTVGVLRAYELGAGGPHDGVLMELVDEPPEGELV